MPVRVGKPAPDIRVEAYIRGESQPHKMKLSDYRSKWVVLFFYPRDFTFVCPTEIQSFARLYREFENERAVVLGASTDSYHTHKAWFDNDPRLQDVQFPVVADTNHQLSELFEVLIDDGSALRATFVIDPDGVVRHIQVNDLDVGRSVDEILRTLRALRTGALCPAGWQPGQQTIGESDMKKLLGSTS